MDKESAEGKLIQLLNICCWRNNDEDLLRHQEYAVPDNAGESLADLLGWYQDKKSRRVSYAKQKLQKLFVHLPPYEQRQVALAMLEGPLTDTEWVCSRLATKKDIYGEGRDVVRWHPDYAKPVKRCWEKYHGVCCGNLFINFMDEKTVRKNLSLFLSPQFYRQLCCRFIGKKWFRLDKALLRTCTCINEYLYFVSVTDEGISTEEARRLLYQHVATLALYVRDNDEEPLVGPLGENYLDCRVINISCIKTTLYYLLKMDHEDVVDEFILWEKTVSSVCEEQISACTDVRQAYKLFVVTLLENLPDDVAYFANHNKYYSYMLNKSNVYTEPRLRTNCIQMNLDSHDTEIPHPYAEDDDDEKDFFQTDFLQDDPLFLFDPSDSPFYPETPFDDIDSEDDLPY